MEIITITAMDTYATMLDSAMVHALAAQGVAGVTADLTIRYLQSDCLDLPLLVSGYVESKLRGIDWCGADVHQNAAHAQHADAHSDQLGIPASG